MHALQSLANKLSRCLIALCITALAVGLGSPTARAQELPNKPIRIIVPFVAGSSIDARVRVMAQALSERLKQQVIVDNKPGAGGSMGSAFVAQAPADGTTWLFTNNSFAINPYVYKNAGYDPLKSLAPVNRGYVSALVVLINSNLKVNSLKELVALAKAQPELLNYGSSGMGSLPHFAAELFFRLAGIKPLHIPFKGDTQVLTEIMGGRISIVFSGIASAQAHIKSGALRALAVTSQQRNSALENVPTMAEAGFPAYNDLIWTGFFVPAATPKNVVGFINKEITAMLNTPSVKARMEATGADVAPMTVVEYSSVVRKEVARYAKLVKDVGLKLE